MSEAYPRKNLCETLFAGHTPSSVGFGCKGSELFWIEQENSDFLVNFCRKIVNLFRKGENFFRMPNLNKQHFCRQGIVPLFSRSSLGRRSVE